MKVKKITKQEPYGYTRLIEQVVNHNAEVLEDVLNRIEMLEKGREKIKPAKLKEFRQDDMTNKDAINIMNVIIHMLKPQYDADKVEVAVSMAIKALEQEPIKDAYIKQVAKERDIAIGQLNELGYSWGEKIEPSDKVITEIEAQEKWLAEAGYNAYNVGVAFEALKFNVLKMAEESNGRSK